MSKFSYLSIMTAVPRNTWTKAPTPHPNVQNTFEKKSLPVENNLSIKIGSVVNENHQNYNSLIQTGMGSAYGEK